MGEVPMSCTECEIFPEGAFQSPQEDIDLEMELKDHPVLRPIPTPEDWPQHGLVEFFYRCAQCSQEWHYAQSDFPFKGWWAKHEPDSSDD
jgi:hypothetical protein